VSVVVPMCNAAAYVLEQVAALLKQSPSDLDFEVIWVDNGSTDDTLQRVADAVRADCRMRVISAPEVPSSYHARNRGAQVARADLVLFCDADDVVDEVWVRSMKAALARLDVVGGALMLDHTTPAVAQGPFFGFLSAAPTANLGIRKDVFEALGGFNGLIPTGEDFALCWRAQLEGFRFGYASNAIVLHRRRATEWARVKRIWTQGRWYADWVAPFVALGADPPTVRAALKRIVDHAVRPMLKQPRREHARVAVWNLGVVASRVRPPKRLDRRRDLPTPPRWKSIR
jgi:GT2 family glycosyltransferase